MTRGNPEQRQRRPLGIPSSLFPVSQGVYADPESFGKPPLSQSHEAPKGHDVVSPGDPAA